MLENMRDDGVELKDDDGTVDDYVRLITAEINIAKNTVFID